MSKLKLRPTEEFSLEGVNTTREGLRWSRHATEPNWSQAKADPLPVKHPGRKVRVVAEICIVMDE